MSNLKREEARRAGLKQYAPARPCKSGHMCNRRVSDNRCMECKKKSEQLCFERKSAEKKEEIKAARKACTQRWRDENPERSRECTRRHELKRMRKKYAYKRPGSLEPTRPMPAACECCGGTQRIALALDHCHVTGAFRGWLCRKCNMSIGSLGDNVHGLLRAIRYLENAVGLKL